MFCPPLIPVMLQALQDAKEHYQDTGMLSTCSWLPNPDFARENGAAVFIGLVQQGFHKMLCTFPKLKAHDSAKGDADKLSNSEVCVLCLAAVVLKRDVMGQQGLSETEKEKKKGNRERAWIGQRKHEHQLWQDGDRVVVNVGGVGLDGWIGEGS